MAPDISSPSKNTRRAQELRLSASRDEEESTKGSAGDTDPEAEDDAPSSLKQQGGL